MAQTMEMKTDKMIDKPATATPTTPTPDWVLDIRREIRIEAPAAVVFDAIIEQCGPGFASMDGKSMDLRLEAWPGGRWFRDLGKNGSYPSGHLWGHVQVIKPPVLLEITGPMFMSYAVASHVQYRLAEKDGVTTLSLAHTAFGAIAAEHRAGVVRGWEHILEQIKARARG